MKMSQNFVQLNGSVAATTTTTTTEISFCTLSVLLFFVFLFPFQQKKAVRKFIYVLLCFCQWRTTQCCNSALKERVMFRIMVIVFSVIFVHFTFLFCFIVLSHLFVFVSVLAAPMQRIVKTELIRLS